MKQGGILLRFDELIQLLQEFGNLIDENIIIVLCFININTNSSFQSRKNNKIRF